MRLLTDLAPCDARRGLAIDEALFESVRSGASDAIRLWIDDRAIIVGRSQAVVDEVDLESATSDGVPVLRRISGGGTVYHYPGNLNVSVVFQDGRCLGSVMEVFRVLGGAVAEGARALCDTVRSVDNDLLIGEAKVGGAAQARRGSALLYHTTLLVGSTDQPMARWLLALRPDYDPTRVASRPRATISLEEAINGAVRMMSLGMSVVGALSRQLSERPVAASLDAEEAARAEDLAEMKYGDSAWNRLL